MTGAVTGGMTGAMTGAVTEEMTGIPDDPRLADAGLAALFAGPGGAGRLAFWQAATGGLAAPDPALERRLAADILQAMGHQPAAALQAARGPMLVRAASALRAEKAGGPAGPGDGAVEVITRRQPFRGFFAVEDMTLRHRRFDGTMTGPLRREVFVSTDAVTVLPWDPVRDLVLLVEQFRTGPVARGGGPVWQIEAIAGRIDAGETPEDTARREAAEEAGVTLGALLPVAGYYPSPGALSEYIHSYVALADLGAVQPGLHGLAEEGEDIRTHLLTLASALDWLAAGRIGNAPLILTLLWLQREAPRLRQGAI